MKPLTIPCEWWWLRAAFIALCGQVEPHPERPVDTWLEKGWEGLVTLLRPEQRYIGTIRFIADGSATQVIIDEPTGIYAEYWREIITRLERFNLDVRQAQRAMFRNHPERAIEYYYRSRAQGSKITMADVAHASDFTEAYLRKIKVAYDKAGKWGSKRKTR